MQKRTTKIINFDLFKLPHFLLNEAIGLRVRFIHDRGQPGLAGNRDIMGELVPADVAFFAVGHIERSEESVSEVFVLTVGFVHLVGLNFLLSSVVNERNGVAGDTDVVDKGPGVTTGGVVNVLEDTAREHGVLLLHVVGLDFSLHFVSDEVLVSEHVSDLAFVDGELRDGHYSQGSYARS